MTLRALSAALTLSAAVFIGFVANTSAPAAAATVGTPDPCTRAAPGSVVPEPRDLRSENGVLKVEMSIRDVREPDGSAHYCYLLPDGSVAPTLRLHPGDLLILTLKNDLVDPDPAAGGKSSAPTHDHSHGSARSSDPCTSGTMSAVSTNLHFHGLTVPPVCHQDDVLKTSIQPSDPPFEYRLQIPANEPPGLYWYHPHIHGFSSKDVSGGASGAMIIEGLERANAEVAGLPERVLVIRDQELVNPNSPPSKSEPVVPRMLIDRG